MSQSGWHIEIKYELIIIMIIMIICQCVRQKGGIYVYFHPIISSSPSIITYACGHFCARYFPPKKRKKNKKEKVSNREEEEEKNRIKIQMRT